MKNIFDKEYRLIEGKLLCPSCFFEVDVETILDNSIISWPNQSWIYFKCPACQNSSHIKIDNLSIETGLLDGAPGPCFVVCSKALIDDFFVDIKADGIVCRYKNQAYRFPARK